MKDNLLHYKLFGKTFKKLHGKCKAEKMFFLTRFLVTRNLYKNDFMGSGALVVIV